MVQLSHPYMTTGKTIALTRWSFVGKVMSLLFTMLSRLVCHSFFSKEQASFNFMATVIICSDFKAQENQVCHSFHCFPIYLPWSDHNCRKLTKLIACITTLSKSMKLWAMLCRATQDGQVMVETKCNPMRKGIANHFSCPENPMNSIKRQKRYHTERWTPQVGRYPICHWKRAEK